MFIRNWKEVFIMKLKSNSQNINKINSQFISRTNLEGIIIKISNKNISEKLRYTLKNNLSI